MGTEHPMVTRRKEIEAWADGDALLLSARCAKAEQKLAETREALRAYHDLVPALAECANDCGDAVLYSDLHRANVNATRALAAQEGGTE